MKYSTARDALVQQDGVRKGYESVKKLSWWRRFLCSLRDHGGISSDSLGYYCKRCGERIKL